jgi:hypothetical protein
MAIKLGIRQFCGVFRQDVPRLTVRMVPGERSSGEATALELFLEALRSIGHDTGIDPTFAVDRKTAGNLGMDKCDCAQTLWRQRPSETRQGSPEKIDTRVAKDRLREDVVEVAPACVDLEGVDTMEMRPLESDHVTADLLLDALLQQPIVRFDAVVVPTGEIGYEEPPCTQRATAEIHQLVVFAQSQSAQQPELHCADQIVPIFGADIGAMRR